MDEVGAPLAPASERLRDGFFEAVGDITLGLVRGRHWRMSAGPLTLLDFDPPHPLQDGWGWRVRGGLLAAGPGGELRLRWSAGVLRSEVADYRPALPGPIYDLTQLPLHHALTRIALLRLRGRVPGPGVPASPAARVVAAAADLTACTGLALALRTRRPLLALLGVAGAYHAGFWALGGRTPGARLLGLRLTSIDGSPVSPAQSLVRMLLAPWALVRGRALHDRAAGTEVVEA